MNLIRVEGPKDVVYGLRNILDLVIAPASIREVEGGRYEAWGRASDSAVAAITARGCDVRVEMDNAALDAHDAAVQAEIEQSREPE